MNSSFILHPSSFIPLGLRPGKRDEERRRLQDVEAGGVERGRVSGAHELGHQTGHAADTDDAVAEAGHNDVTAMAQPGGDLRGILRRRHRVGPAGQQ